MICAAAMLCLLSSANAQDETDNSKIGRIRNDLITKSPTWVAQEVRFYVELMSPTLFSGTPRFELPEVPGVILMKEEGRPILGSTTVDDDSWTTQRHEFRAYAHRTGKITIPSFPVRFSVAPAFGSPPEVQRMKTAAMNFESRMPPGAEDVALLVSTTQLDANEKWSPSLDDERKIKLQVGDAIRRQISMEAVDVPGMALPPIDFPKPSGLAAYPMTPEVSDKTNRGDLTGTRTDGITYVCEQPGEFTFPAMVITWWDLKRSELHRVTFDEVTVEIESSSETQTANAESPTQPGGPNDSDGPPWTALLVGAIAAGLLYGIYHKFIAPWLQRRQEAMARSSKGLFQEACTACRANDAPRSYNAVIHWLDALGANDETGRFESFGSAGKNDGLQREWNKLQAALVKQGSPWQGDALLAELKLFQDRLKQDRKNRTDRFSALPDLNPGVN